LHFMAGLKTHPKPPDAIAFPPLIFFILLLLK